MTEFTLTFKHSEYGIAASKPSKRSALGKRDFDTKGIDVDISAIPAPVLQKLLLDALETKLQAAVKKLDMENCTVEQAQAAMREALASLKSGKKAVRKQSAAAAIKAEAKRMLKAEFKERNFGDEELDAKALTEQVNDCFKDYDTWKKTGDENLADIGQVVESFLEAAKTRLEEKAKTGNVLDKLLSDRAKAASGSARESAPKATPTQAETARRTTSKAKGGGRSA